MTTNGKPKFDLGQLLSTPGALEALEDSNQTPADFISRHALGDWGEELCQEDKRLNDQAISDGSRILSAYRTHKGVKLWVITEAVGDDGHRAATTCLLPSEY
jgi:hypothetical protein